MTFANNCFIIISIINKEVILINEENKPIQTDLLKYEITNIKNLIYTIRGKQVMLDSDVAMLYHYPTKRINETVKRNLERFPESFCFQLEKHELENLRSQIATSSSREENYGGRRYLPYVFTEQGIAMLSGLLKNNTAIQVSINIMNAFVEMRKFITSNAHVFERLINIEYQLLEHDKKFDEVFNALQKNKENEFKQKIFFQGQIYDAYCLIIDIIKTANDKILIIDNYIDDNNLKMLTKKHKNVKVNILTSHQSNITKLDIQKFNQEYPSLTITKTNKFHDRFMIIDNQELYHIGASLKDLGKKCFAISKINDLEYVEKMSKIS